MDSNRMTLSKEEYNNYMKNYRKTHPEYMEKANIRLKEKRLKLMDVLGGRICSNCGFNDIRALQIDHKNGQGHRERLNHKDSNYLMYLYYLKNLESAKEKLQVLCANCNWIKRSVDKECKGKLNENISQN